MRSRRSTRARSSSFSASRSPLRAAELRRGSCSHQSMPIERAVSADAINRRSLSVRSSMSSSCTVMSPASSTRSTVTFQPRPPSRETAAIDSAGLPKSSATWLRAALAASSGESFVFRSSLVATEPLQELLLDQLVLLLVELAAVERLRRLRELEPDPPRVVQLRLRLGDDLVEHPDEPAGGRERQRQKTLHEAHQAGTPSSSSTKLYGGSGPTSSK